MIEPALPPHEEPHDEAQSLLPWYLTGQLSASERAAVETHLTSCPRCRADVASERRLIAELVDLPVEVELGWTRLRERLDPKPQAAARGGARREVGRRWRAGLPWLGWALAAGQIAVFAVVGQAIWPAAPPARYHTLAGVAALAAGNVVVIFRPDTRERELRATLEASHARVVDGPTAADAYVLRVPASQRLAALATLRARPDITLAEPIDAPP